jgi:hypothetical protein
MPCFLFLVNRFDSFGAPSQEIERIIPFFAEIEMSAMPPPVTTFHGRAKRLLAPFHPDPSLGHFGLINHLQSL